MKFNVFSSEGGTAEDALEPAELSTGGTLLRYYVTGGQFIQNWQTPRPADPACAIGRR